MLDTLEEVLIVCAVQYPTGTRFRLAVRTRRIDTFGEDAVRRLYKCSEIVALVRNDGLGAQLLEEFPRTADVTYLPSSNDQLQRPACSSTARCSSILGPQSGALRIGGRIFYAPVECSSACSDRRVDQDLFDLRCACYRERTRWQTPFPRHCEKRMYTAFQRPDSTGRIVRLAAAATYPRIASGNQRLR